MSSNKVNIRPVIEGLKIDDSMSQAERFQNTTLRPIIKLQHDLLIEYFQNYLNINNIKFDQLPLADKKQVVANSFNKDHKMRLELRGFIIGQFILPEYRHYHGMSAELNKRMLSMIQERIISVL